jgi:mannose-1-phosphate guanylyltransferase
MTFTEKDYINIISYSYIRNAFSMNTLNQNHYAVIMAGGVGSRFWPWSTKDCPKQFLDIMGTGETLLQLTYNRFKKIVPENNIYIITNKAYDGLIRQQLNSITSKQIIAEPMAMNTAPCVAYANAKIQAENPNAVCIFAPSDHLVLKEDVFVTLMTEALQHASQHDQLLTIGIQPNRPDTGYGYIQYHRENDHQTPPFKVKTFTEKPNIELAQTFVDSGEFLWNAGIFTWSCKAIQKAIQTHQPDMAALFEDGMDVYNTPDEAAFIEKTYPLCKSNSIDYAIMEKADNVQVIPADLGWSDLGTWKSLFDVREKNEQHNVIQGNSNIVMNTSQSLILNQDQSKLLVVNGLDNVMIVQTENAILICNMDREQEVKQMVNEVKAKFKDRFS